MDDYEYTYRTDFRPNGKPYAAGNGRQWAPDPPPLPPPPAHRAKPSSASSSSSGGGGGWGLNDAEMKRRRRVASYKAYTVEGKVKASIRKGIRWIKIKCSELVHGW